MRNKITSSWLRCSMGVLSGALLSMGTLTTALASPQSLNFAPLDLAQRAKPATHSRTMFVRFATPSVAEMVLANRAAGAVMQRGAQSTHARQIANEQAALSKQIEALGAKVVSSMRVGANGMRIQIRPDQISAIRALPGVQSISPVAVHTLDLSRSVAWVGAPTVWADSGDGSGITIAIIDSGVDYLHANLGGSGDPDEYANNDFNVVEAGTFPTSKVIGGWDFAGPVYNASSSDPALQVPSPDPDPLDGNGHGSHVAGIAAGLGVPDSIAPGVAKGASIYALKVFSDTSGSTDLTSDAIEWALDPNGDGDISDHVDVINMSLGSPFGLPGDPSAISATNAAELGIIVVASAGNSGNVPYVTGAPAVGPRVISVAASLTGGDVPAISVSGAPADGLYEAVEGVGAVRVADGVVSGDLVVAQPLQACSDDGSGNPVGLDNDIAGGVALVQRGTCSFDLKYLNAQMSGASAIVVYNDGASPSRIAPITMGGVGNLGFPVTIPGVMIASTAGEFLNNTVTAGNALSSELNAALSTPTEYGDSMAGFSSRGPGHGNSTFKPDLSAPGVSTVSTGAGSGTGAASLSGTSMAAPHVAGAAALMRQAFPDASVTAIKAMLMNSTVDAQPDGLIGPMHALSRQGVGVLRVDNAAALTSYATPAGVAFGRLNPKKPKRVKTRVTVKNLSSSERTFEIVHVAQQEMPGVSVRAIPGSIHVKAGKSKSFLAEISVDPALAPADDGSFSQSEVDGWFMLNDGIETLRVGYFAVVDPASSVKANGGRGEIELINSGRTAGVAEGFTLSPFAAIDDDDDSDSGESDASLSRDSDSDDDSDDDSHAPDTAAARALGYRTSVVSGFRVVELGIDLDEAWESMSDRTIDVYLDIDQDGADDVLLEATDFSAFNGAIGSMVTAQFDLVGGGGFLDWFVSTGDYNDSSAAMIFTRVADGGLVPDSFDYRLEVSSSDGSTSVEFGSIDLANEIIPATPSLVIDGGDTAAVSTSGATGHMLWLYQNNQVGRQSQEVRVH